jgi:cytochrome c553
LIQRLVATALWIALGALVPLGAAQAGDNARGQALFALCAQCHGAAGGGNPATLAPAIAGLDQSYVELQLEKFRSGIRGMDPKDMGGLRMHPMSLWLAKDADLEAVAAYVASLPAVEPAAELTGGNAARGKQLYTPCIACHAVDGSGNPAMKAPALKGRSDWYLLSSLEKFKGGIRGSNPADQGGTIMRAMAGTLPDEQAMRDVIAHIKTLSN